MGIINNSINTRNHSSISLPLKNSKIVPKPIRIKIAILDNGTGYTVPQAVKKIENVTKIKPQAISFSSPFKDSYNETLTEQVKNIIAFIEKKKLHLKFNSRAEAFLELIKDEQHLGYENPCHTSQQVVNMATFAAKNLDGIFLPGGDDIPSIWYGGSDADNIYRSLIEITWISEARKRGIPLMGVCRGFQMVNVFNGKKLVANVPNQYGTQTFKLIDNRKAGLLANIFKETVNGRVMHHQGVSVEQGMNGKGDLEALTRADGLIKAAESKYPASAPIIITQFHPELYTPNSTNGLTSNNDKFFKIFHQSTLAKGYKRSITPRQLIDAKKNLRPTKQN